LLGCVAGAMAGMAGVVLAPGLFLVVDETLALFLSLGLGALISALGAFWFGDVLAPPRTRGRLLAIVGVAEAVAGVLAGGALAADVLGLDPHPLPLGGRLFLGNLVVVLAAGVAAWGLRVERVDAGREDVRDAWVSVALLAVGALCLVGGFVYTGVVVCGSGPCY
jgi:hypothetical protein